MNRELMKILEKIAQEHGTNVEEVQKEMKLAIAEAWNNGSPTDEFVKTFGKKKPTIEEFITKSVGRIKEENEI